MNGWLKLHRKFLESEIFTDERLLQVWLGLLIKAAYKEQKIKYGNQQKTLSVGQVWYCLRTESKRLGLAPSTLREKMKYLEKSARVSYTSGRFGYIVTICNWKQYQSGEDLDQTETAQKPNNPRTIPEQSPPHTKKERRQEGKEWNTLLALWNENCGTLPKAKSWSTKREKLAEAAWKFNKDPGFYLLGIKNIAKDPWANGSKPSPTHQNWRADFDYFLRDPNKWSERNQTFIKQSNDLQVLE